MIANSIARPSAYAKKPTSPRASEEKREVTSPILFFDEGYREVLTEGQQRIAQLIVRILVDDEKFGKYSKKKRVELLVELVCYVNSSSADYSETLPQMLDLLNLAPDVKDQLICELFARENQENNFLRNLKFWIPEWSRATEVIGRSSVEKVGTEYRVVQGLRERLRAGAKDDLVSPSPRQTAKPPEESKKVQSTAFAGAGSELQRRLAEQQKKMGKRV